MMLGTSLEGCDKVYDLIGRIIQISNKVLKFSVGRRPTETLCCLIV